jgi:DNA-binding NtrC family response regulator
LAVLITDSAMHGMTGYELVQAVRRPRPEPAIVVSSSESSENSPRFEALAGFQSLSKPVHFHRIAAVIDCASGAVRTRPDISCAKLARRCAEWRTSCAASGRSGDRARGCGISAPGSAYSARGARWLRKVCVARSRRL